MAGQYIPLPEHAPPPLPREMPPEERFRAWLDLLAAGEQFMIAGFKRQAGDGGDWQAVYRRWYEQKQEERLHQRLRRASELAERTE